MTLEQLVVEIKGDNTNFKQRIKEVQSELKKTSDRVDELREKLKSWDDMGLSGTAPYKDLVKELEEAENKQYDLNNEIERYNAIQNEAGATTEQSSQKMRLFGRNISTAATRMFGLYKIISEAKQALEDFQENNPNNPVTTSIKEAKDSWAELKEDLIFEMGPAIETIAEMVTMINEQSKPINEAVGYLIKMLDDAGILELLKDILWVTNEIVIGPLKLLNMGFEDLYGKTSKVKINLEDINIQYRDLTKYYEKINQATAKQKQLLGGFDELNIFAKQDDADKQKEINELTDYYLDLKDKQKEIDSQINDIWKEYADALGISVEDYKKLYGYWASGDTKRFTDLVGQLGINEETAKNNLEQFVREGLPKINDLKRAYSDLATEIEKVLKLLNDRNAVVPGGRRKVPLDLDTKERNNGNPSTWTGKKSNPEKQSFLEKAINWFNQETGFYADGGVFTSPTLGWVGEYSGASTNPEIITPQSLMFETMQEANGILADVIAQATAQVVSAISNQNLEVSIGDDVIASSAARGNRNYYQMTGGYLI